MVRRMQAVCGARNFSLALRNGEHLARYVFTGAWLSLQMLDGITPSEQYTPMALWQAELALHMHEHNACGAFPMRKRSPLGFTPA